MFAEDDAFAGSGVGGIKRRIVKRARHHQPGTGRHVTRLLEVITELPLEIITRHVQQGLAFAVGEQEFVAHPFPPEVHVREEAIDGGRFSEGEGGGVPGLGGPGRDVQIELNGLPGFGGALRRVRGEIEGDLALIRRLRSVGGVVQLQRQLRIGGQLFRHASGVFHGSGTGRPADKKHPLAAAGVRRAGPLGVKDHMMHHLAVAGLHIEGAQPDVFLEGVGHLDVTVIQHPGGGDLLHFGHLEHRVGFPQRPLGQGSQRHFQGVGALPARRPGFHPPEDGLRFFPRQRMRVDEFTVVRMRVPRRHAAGQQHFLDHFSLVGHAAMFVHAEGSDPVGTMAGHTMLLQQWRDLRGVVRRRTSIGYFGIADPAAVRAGLRSGDFLARQKGGQGLFEILFRRGRFLRPFRQLIVDRPPVKNAPVLGVDGYHFRGALHLQGQRQALLAIQQTGHAPQTQFLALLPHVLFRVVRIGVHQPEIHAPALEAVIQVSEFQRVLADDGAAGAGEHQHHHPARGAVQLVIGVVQVEQREIGHGRPVPGAGRQVGQQQRPQQDQRLRQELGVRVHGRSISYRFGRPARKLLSGAGKP